MRIRKQFDSTAPLFVRRAFLWDGVTLVEGDTFPADGVRIDRIRELWSQHYIDHDPPVAAVAVEALEPGTGVSPVPAAAQAPDATPPRIEPKHVKVTPGAMRGGREKGVAPVLSPTPSAIANPTEHQTFPDDGAPLAPPPVEPARKRQGDKP